MRNIRWIMWLTLSCSHSSCRDRKERLISATESSLSSTLSDTEFSDSDWLSPESSTVIQDTVWPIHTRKNADASLTLTLRYIRIYVYAFWLWDPLSTPYQRTAEALITSLTWWFSRQLLWFLAWCKLLGISQRAEEGSKGVAGDVLVVVALVCHLTGAQHSHSIQDPSLREQCGHDK